MKDDDRSLRQPERRPSKSGPFVRRDRGSQGSAHQAAGEEFEAGQPGEGPEMLHEGALLRPKEAPCARREMSFHKTKIWRSN